MNFNEITRELSSNSGYIHRLDDSLYVNYSIYLGIYDNPSNYEEGNQEDYEAWIEAHSENEEDIN